MVEMKYAKAICHPNKRTRALMAGKKVADANKNGDVGGPAAESGHAVVAQAPADLENPGCQLLVTAAAGPTGVAPSTGPAK